MKNYYYLPHLSRDEISESMTAISEKKITVNESSYLFTVFNNNGSPFESHQLYLRNGITIKKIEKKIIEKQTFLSIEFQSDKGKNNIVKFRVSQNSTFQMYVILINNIIKFMKSNHEKIITYGFKEEIENVNIFTNINLKTYIYYLLKMKTQKLEQSIDRPARDNVFEEFIIITLPTSDTYFIKLLKDYFHSPKNEVENNKITFYVNRDSAWSPSHDDIISEHNYYEIRERLIEFFYNKFNYNEGLLFSLLKR